MHVNVINYKVQRLSSGKNLIVNSVCADMVTVLLNSGVFKAAQYLWASIFFFFLSSIYHFTTAQEVAEM